MASKARRAKLGELPPLEVPDLEHHGVEAAAAAIAEATAELAPEPDAGTAGAAETPLSPSADGTRDRSPVSAHPASSSAESAEPAPVKRGRGRPRGSRTRRRLTGEQLERRATEELRELRAQLAERTQAAEQLREQLEVATAGDDAQLAAFSRELFTTASGLAVVYLQDGRWMLNPQQLERLGQLGAPVARKYLAQHTAMTPEIALVVGIGAVILEKMQEPPQPLPALALVQ